MRPSVTNTLQNGTFIDGSKIDKNFTDIINAESDGTKDFNVKAATCNSITATSTLRARGSLTATNLTATTANARSITATAATTNRQQFVLEQKTISQANTITPSSSLVELNSFIYQTATFASIEITTNNNKIDFTEGSTERTATITPGTYLPVALATEIETQLNAVGAYLYACTFNITTQSFTLVSDTQVTIRWRTGTNWRVSIGLSLGFDVVQDVSSKTFTSTYPYQIAYSNNLSTITATNFVEGSILILKKKLASASKILTLINGTGNIACGSDREFTDNTIASLVLIGTTWKLMSI